MGGVITVALVLHYASKYIHNYFQISSIAFYMLFYVAGMAYQEHAAEIKLKRPFMTVVATFVALVILYCLKTYIPQTRILVSFAGIVFLLATSKALAKTTITNNKIYQSVSKNNFGIYLFHPILIYLAVTYIKPSQGMVSLLLYAAVLTIVVYLVSWGLTALMRKSHLKIFLGE